MRGSRELRLRFLSHALAAFSLAGALVDCGGGLPLLHPARTLPAGAVRVAAGFSGAVAAGALGSSLRGATSELQASPGTVPRDAVFAQGALVAASVGPGLAPIVSARVGLGAQVEGGIAYTARAIRVDVRRSFELADEWSFSVGVGGSAALYDRDALGTLPGVDLEHLHGWGADVPLLVGYQSAGGLYALWLGARGGWEHADVGLEASEPGPASVASTSVSLAATRVWGGGLVGFAVGFRHVHVAMELDVGYADVTGDLASTHARVMGITLAPSSALWLQF